MMINATIENVTANITHSHRIVDYDNSSSNNNPLDDNLFSFSAIQTLLQRGIQKDDDSYVNASYKCLVWNFVSGPNILSFLNILPFPMPYVVSWPNDDGAYRKKNIWKKPETNLTVCYLPGLCRQITTTKHTQHMIGSKPSQAAVTPLAKKPPLRNSCYSFTAVNQGLFAFKLPVIAVPVGRPPVAALFLESPSFPVSESMLSRPIPTFFLQWDLNTLPPHPPAMMCHPSTSCQW